MGVLPMMWASSVPRRDVGNLPSIGRLCLATTLLLLPLHGTTSSFVPSSLSIVPSSPARIRNGDLFDVQDSTTKGSFGRISSSSTTPMVLLMSLKPAAVPLMDSGKALARSGELLVEVTESMEIYGGALSAAGAGIRNAGDCVAQAAASCRFKFGKELVCDELREAATCLSEASGKLRLAVEEARVDENSALASCVETAVLPLEQSGATMEAAGENIMRGTPPSAVGDRLSECGNHLTSLSESFKGLSTDDKCALSAQRMEFAATKMIEAGNELRGVPKEKPKGRAFLKGM